LHHVSGESLQEATLSGARWLMLTRVAGETLALATTVVLARLISPADFGRAAVAVIFVPLAIILTFEGFASALVQRDSIDPRHLRSAMAMSLLGGVLLSALAFALQPLLWRPLFGARTAGLMGLAAPVFLLASVGSVSRALLWRSLDFRRMSLIDVSGLAVGSMTALALALAGLAARAIVFGALAQVTIASLLLLVIAPAPLPRWHRDSQRELGAFGLPAALAGLAEVLFRNVDYAILAARLTATQTGIYWRAFNLGVVYQDKLSGVMMQLAFPVYSRTESRAQLRALHERATRVHAAVIFAPLASLIVLAPAVIPFVLGSAWAPSVHPAQILAVAGMVAAILTGYPQVMLALGRPRALLRFNLVRLAIYAAAVALAAGHGLIVVSLAVAGAYLAILVGVYLLLLGPNLGLSLRQLAGELGPALAASLALVGVGEPLRLALEGTLPAPLAIVLVGAAGLGAYAVTLRTVSPAAWQDLLLLSRRILPRGSGLAALRLRRGHSPAV
jgi:PST family polysaccharide transporter